MPPPPPPPPTRIIIIGAGWAGLATAKTYLQMARRLDRRIELTVLDNAPAAPGGVWNPSRLYPGLLVQGLNGFYEFSDLSMIDDEHPYGSIVTGERVQSYCEYLLFWLGFHKRTLSHPFLSCYLVLVLMFPPFCFCWCSQISLCSRRLSLQASSILWAGCPNLWAPPHLLYSSEDYLIERTGQVLTSDVRMGAHTKHPQQSNYTH